MKKTLAIFTAIIIATTAASCQGQTSPEKESSFLKQLTQLPEFKAAEMEADSLKKAGAQLEFSFSIIESSPFPEDSLKNLSIGVIEYDFGPDDLTLYWVKYDKGKGKIISIEKRYTETDLKIHILFKGNEEVK